MTEKYDVEAEANADNVERAEQQVLYDLRIQWMKSGNKADRLRYADAKKHYDEAKAREKAKAEAPTVLEWIDEQGRRKPLPRAEDNYQRLYGELQGILVKDVVNTVSIVPDFRLPFPPEEKKEPTNIDCEKGEVMVNGVCTKYAYRYNIHLDKYPFKQGDMLIMKDRNNWYQYRVLFDAVRYGDSFGYTIDSNHQLKTKVGNYVYFESESRGKIPVAQVTYFKIDEDYVPSVSPSSTIAPKIDEHLDNRSRNKEEPHPSAELLVWDGDKWTSTPDELLKKSEPLWAEEDLVPPISSYEYMKNFKS